MKMSSYNIKFFGGRLISIYMIPSLGIPIAVLAGYVGVK